MSNLVKQHYVINYGNETRVIHADERFKQANPIPSSEEIIDGFLAGLDVEEVQLEPEITPEEIL